MSDISDGDSGEGKSNTFQIPWKSGEQQVQAERKNSNQLQQALIKDRIEMMKSREMQDTMTEPTSTESIDLAIDVPICHQLFLKSTHQPGGHIYSMTSVITVQT